MRGRKCCAFAKDLSGPVIDLFKVYVCHPIVLPRSSVGVIEESLGRTFNLQLKHQRPKGKKLERFFVLADQCHPSACRYAIIIEGNGIVHLRQTWEPESLEIAPESFDGNVNHFQDTGLYSRSGGLSIQIEWLRSRIEEAIQILQTVLADAGSPDQKIIVKFTALEFAWHHVSADGVERYLEQRSQQMRLAHPEVNMGGLRADGSARGYRADQIVVGAESAAYQKSPDTVREEIKLKERFFEEHKQILNKLTVAEQLTWLAAKAEALHAMTFAAAPPAARGLTQDEAYAEFASVCPKRCLGQFIKGLRAGAGLIVVKSVNGPLYRAARILTKSGKLERDVARRSTYRLTPAYRALLEGSVTVEPKATPRSEAPTTEQHDDLNGGGPDDKVA